MMPTKNGALHLFRVRGINVYVHWTWFLVIWFVLQLRVNVYEGKLWNLIEYLSLFGIVLLHEFGHALACRQVGGTADQIVLWPLGGVAYVAPPPRPGPTLWSIAAGPLVNVALVPILFALNVWAASQGGGLVQSDFGKWLSALQFMNLLLLVFNMLPVYPLDGGQILRALLWFPLGRARSLLIATIFGFIGVAALAAFAFLRRDLFLGFIALMVFMNCRTAWMQARALGKLAALPRHANLSCPSCHSSPPAGDLWKCGGCQTAFDLFANGGVCPQCHSRYDQTRCPECGHLGPVSDWEKK
ncbi:MAG: site-2 protease family protein [Chthoniobacteraceae bacterium]